MLHQHGYPEARGRIAAAPIHQNEDARIIEAMRQRHFSLAQSSTGAAGEFPHVELFMPGDARYWAIIDEVELTSLTAQQIVGRLTTVDFGTTLSFGAGAVDGVQSSRARSGSFSGALQTGQAIVSLDVLASTKIPLPDRGRVLRPGQGYFLQGITAVTTIRVLWRWREIDARQLTLP